MLSCDTTQFLLQSVIINYVNDVCDNNYDDNSTSSGNNNGDDDDILLCVGSSGCATWRHVTRTTVCLV